MKRQIFKLTYEKGNSSITSGWVVVESIIPIINDSMIPISKWQHIFCNKWGDASTYNFLNI